MRCGGAVFINRIVKVEYGVGRVNEEAEGGLIDIIKVST